jgi:hypothetical protein
MARFVFVFQLVVQVQVETNGMISVENYLTPDSTASTPNSSATSTPRQLSSAISATSTTANGSYQRPGKPASQWVVRSAKSLERSSHLIPWSGLAARRLSGLVLLFRRGLSSFSSLRGRCRCFWLGSCWEDWYEPFCDVRLRFNG